MGNKLFQLSLAACLVNKSSSPAQNALMFAVVGSGHLRGRRGRHKTNLLDILRKDLNARQLSLKTHSDILRLRDVAIDHLSWRTLY